MNSVISNNTSWLGGGIACYSDSSCKIENCTISGNVSSFYGGAIVGNSFTTVINSIIWGNTAPSDPEIRNAINVSYSNIQGGYPGEGNINADPLFVDPENGDYHLTAGPPCIDAGTSDGAPEFDFEGNSRYDDPNTEPNTGAGTYTYYDIGTH